MVHGPGRAAAAALTAVVLSAAVGCGSSSEAQDGGSGGAEAPRIETLTGLASGDGLVLVAQTDHAGSDPTIRLLDPETEEWSSVPEPPFTAALDSPNVEWDGDEFVVLGTPCEREGPHSGDALFDCEPGGTEIARFDPRSKTWSTAIRRPLDGPGSAVLVGLHGRSAVIGEWRGYGQPNGYLSFVLVDLLTGRSIDLPEPPIPPSTLCVGGDQLVAAAQWYEPSSQSGEGVNNFDPLRATAISLTDPRRWSEPVGSGVVHHVTDPIDNIVCTADGALAVHSEAPDHGAPLQSYLFDAAAHRWEPTPAPPMPFGVATASITDGRTTTIWTDRVVASRDADGTWAVAPDEGTAVRAALIDPARAAVIRHVPGRTDEGKVRYGLEIEAISTAP